MMYTNNELHSSAYSKNMVSSHQDKNSADMLVNVDYLDTSGGNNAANYHTNLKTSFGSME